MYGQNNGYYMPNYNPYPAQGNGAVPDALAQAKMQYQVPQMPMARPSNDFIWVQGEAGAKAYLVAPGQTVQLWDSESNTLYIKSADERGVPAIRVLDYAERTETHENASNSHECKCKSNFPSKEQFEQLTAKIDAIQAKLDGLMPEVEETPKKTAKKAKEADE